MSDTLSLGTSFRTDNMFSHSEIKVQKVIRKKLHAIVSIEQLSIVHFVDLKKWIGKLVLFISKRYEAFKDIALEFLDILWKIQIKCQTAEERQMFDDFTSDLTENCSLIICFGQATANFRREFFQRWSRILSGIEPETLTFVALYHIESLQNIGEMIFTVGHILTQLGGLEIFVKYLGNNVQKREEILNAVIPSNKLSIIRQMLISFDVNNFDLEARKVLNHFNMFISEDRMVYSVKAEKAFIEEIEIIKPKHKGQEVEFWTDFNGLTKSVSFFCSRSTFSFEDNTWMYIEIFEPSIILDEKEYSMTVTLSSLVAEPSGFSDYILGKETIKIFYNKTTFYSLIPGVKIVDNNLNLHNMNPKIVEPELSTVNPTRKVPEEDDRSIFNDTESVSFFNQQRTSLSKPSKENAEFTQIVSNFSYQQPVPSHSLKEHPLSNCISSTKPENISKDIGNEFSNSIYNEKNQIEESVVNKCKEVKESHLNNSNNAVSDVESNEQFVPQKEINKQRSSDIFSNIKSNDALNLQKSSTQPQSSSSKKNPFSQKLPQLNTQKAEMFIKNSNKASKNVDDDKMNDLGKKVQISSTLPPSSSKAIDQPKSKRGRKKVKQQASQSQKLEPQHNISQKCAKELNKEKSKKNTKSILKNESGHSVKNSKDCLIKTESNTKQDISKNQAPTFIKSQPTNPRKDCLTNTESNIKQDISRNQVLAPTFINSQPDNPRKDCLTNNESSTKQDMSKNQVLAPIVNKSQPKNARSSVYDIENLLIEDAREQKKFSKPKNIKTNHIVSKFIGENKTASFSYRKNKNSKLGYYSKELRTDTESENKSIKRQSSVNDVKNEPQKKKAKKQQPVTEPVKSVPKRVSLPRAKKPVNFNFSQSESSHVSTKKKNKSAPSISKNKSNITENTIQAPPETNILGKKNSHSQVTEKFAQNINNAQEDTNKETDKRKYHGSYDSIEVAYPSGNQNVRFYLENLQKNTEINCDQAISVPQQESNIYDKNWILNRYIQELNMKPTLQDPYDNSNEETFSPSQKEQSVVHKDNSAAEESSYQSDIGDDNVDQESYGTKTSEQIAQSNGTTKLTENNGININLTYNINSNYQNHHVNPEQISNSTRKRECSFADGNLATQKRLRYETDSSDVSQNYDDEAVETLVAGFEKKTNAIVKRIRSEVEKRSLRSNVTNIIANIFKSYFKPYKCYVKRSMASLQQIEELQNKIKKEFEKFMELETFCGKQMTKMRGALLKIKMENSEEKHNKLKSHLTTAIDTLIAETNEASDAQWRNYVDSVANAYAEKIRKHSEFF